MNWEQLLSTKKLAEDEELPKVFDRFPINAFEKDYAQLVTGAAFRRLQDKTQVFPLDKGDFVRTRLTHSIEVSTVARQLGMMLADDQGQYRKEELAQYREQIPPILMCAALLHDLGNPPFGHFGEALIGEWFRTVLDRIEYKGRPLRSWLTGQMAADLEHFEGNAQALRMVTKARHRRDISLTMPVMATLIKYPTDSLSFDRRDPDIKKHKLGFYTAEAEVFRTIADTLGMRNENGEICRHPLTYLLEAADDIAYATADLEDALNKGLFTLDVFIQYYQSCYRPEDVQEKQPLDYTDRMIRRLLELRGGQSTPERDAAVFRSWLSELRSWFMYTAVYRFVASYDEIMAGTFREDLFYQTNHSETIRILKQIMAEFAYDSVGALRLEMAAESVVTFLLDKLVHAVLYCDEAYQDRSAGYVPSSVDQKYLFELPRDYQADYDNTRTGEEGMDLYLRILMATDFLSGMTDSFARTLYRQAIGIE